MTLLNGYEPFVGSVLGGAPVGPAMLVTVVGTAMLLGVVGFMMLLAVGPYVSPRWAEKFPSATDEGASDSSDATSGRSA